jgi:ubiquinone/menaquinone biosynthesis C-methylase UbiE
MLKIECGSGFHPAPGYIHVDINPSCPGLDYVSSVDNLPMFENNSADEIRSIDVLEHFSYRKTLDVLKEWYRILKSGGKLHVQCPNAKLLAQRWLNNDLPLMNGMPIDYSASYWIMGGHNDGVFAKDDDTWRYNAHYTLFSPESLKFYLEKVGFKNIDIQSDGGSNLICWCEK